MKIIMMLVLLSISLSIFAQEISEFERGYKEGLQRCVEKSDFYACYVAFNKPDSIHPYVNFAGTGTSKIEAVIQAQQFCSDKEDSETICNDVWTVKCKKY